MRFKAGNVLCEEVEEGWRSASARCARESASSGSEVWRSVVALASSVAGLSEGFLEPVLERGTVVPFRTDLVRFKDLLEGFVLAICLKNGGLVIIRDSGALQAVCALPGPAPRSRVRA